IGVVGREKSVPTTFFCLENPSQLAIAEFTIPDKVDAAYTGKFALVDFEHEIDPVLRELNHLWFDARSKSPVPAIEIEDALHIVLHSRPGVDHARTQLNLGVEVLVVELTVALKRNTIDDRVLDDLDDQGIAGPTEIDVGKQPGGKQRLQRLVHALIVPGVAGLDQQIGANCLGLDPLHALDTNFADRSAAHLGKRWTAGRRLRADRLWPIKNGNEHRAKHDPQRGRPPDTMQTD